MIFQGLPDKESNTPYDDTRRVVNSILQGKINTNSTLTIGANTTETTVSNQNVGNNSFISFIGLDSNSLTGNIYIKNRGTKTFTIGHDSVNVQRNYSYIVIG